MSGICISELQQENWKKKEKQDLFLLLWQVELFGYHKQYSITFVVCASLQHVCGLGIWLIQQVIVLLLFYSIHCWHYGLLTSWCRSCSNFPNGKSRLRGCSRQKFQLGTQKFCQYILSSLPQSLFFLSLYALFVFPMLCFNLCFFFISLSNPVIHLFSWDLNQLSHQELKRNKHTHTCL